MCLIVSYLLAVLEEKHTLVKKKFNTILNKDQASQEKTPIIGMLQKGIQGIASAYKVNTHIQKYINQFRYSSGD